MRDSSKIGRVVYELPGMEHILVKKDIVYKSVELLPFQERGGGATFRNRFAREQKEEFGSTNLQAKALLFCK